ncbi:VOC family protein [Paracoccus rhizosphaerae]|uniref:VOC family protein n=1 Tax=Paracoccus rhizosphaerae TaxID=1133347 RepID=UPI00223F7A35|nr:VOC family protein [Paracoccus rhizosphaerae]
MKPHVTVVTLGVADLARSLAFYRDGLGLPTEGIIGEEYDHGAVVFFDLAAGLKLALWARADIAHDTGLNDAATDPIGVTIGHNVASRTRVDEVMPRRPRRAPASSRPPATRSMADMPAISPIPTTTCGRWSGTPRCCPKADPTQRRRQAVRGSGFPHDAGIRPWQRNS